LCWILKFKLYPCKISNKTVAIESNEFKLILELNHLNS
jgi:hypothetical protein